MSMIRITPRWTFWLSAWLLLISSCLPARAADDVPRHALVVSNAAYESRPLANPHADADLVAASLHKVGFKVTAVRDQDRKGLFATVRHFADNLPAGAIAFVYYAGHGLQVEGSNYLSPLGMTPTSAPGIARNAYPVRHLLDTLAETRSAINIVVLDACRNNPFLPTQPVRYRSYDDLGLARIASPKGTLIAYSTAPGQLAEDGLGRKNGWYAEALANEILKPGQTLETVLKRTGETVRRQTYEDQQPWYESSLADSFYFIPPPGVRIVTQPPKQYAQVKSETHTRGAAGEGPWYLQLDERGWSTFDWEIGQRVKRLTEDEIPLLEHRAKAGNVVAMTTLGIAYREGTQRITESGTNRSFRANASNVKALEWLRKAAEADFPMAQVELGEMYYTGHGVDRDLAQSIHWLEKAARVRYPRAKLDLAQAKAVAAPSRESVKAMGSEAFKAAQEVMNQSIRQQQGK